HALVLSSLRCRRKRLGARLCNRASLDDLIRPQQQRGRNREGERLSGPRGVHLRATTTLLSIEKASPSSSTYRFSRAVTSLISAALAFSSAPATGPASAEPAT